MLQSLSQPQGEVGIAEEDGAGVTDAIEDVDGFAGIADALEDVARVVDTADEVAPPEPDVFGSRLVESQYPARDRQPPDRFVPEEHLPQKRGRKK